MSLELRTANRSVRAKCSTKVTRSALPAAIIKTLLNYLDNIGSATHYTYCFKSQRTLAADMGISLKTLEHHTKVIRESGILYFKPLNLDQAKALLLSFDHKKPIFFKDKLNFVSINARHPFWGNDKDAVQGVVDLVKKLMKARYEKRSRCEAPFNSRPKHPSTEGVKHPSPDAMKHPSTEGVSIVKEETVEMVSPLSSQEELNNESSGGAQGSQSEQLFTPVFDVEKDLGVELNQMVMDFSPEKKTVKLENLLCAAKAAQRVGETNSLHSLVEGCRPKSVPNLEDEEDHLDLENDADQESLSLDETSDINEVDLLLEAHLDF